MEVKNRKRKMVAFGLVCAMVIGGFSVHGVKQLKDHKHIVAEADAGTDKSGIKQGYVGYYKDKTPPYTIDGKIYTSMNCVTEGTGSASVTHWSYGAVATGGSVVVYANGTTSGQKTKTATLFTNLRPAANFTEKTKGVVKATAGKLVAGVTMKDTLDDTTYVKNKIVDKEAAKYAKASISNQVITVTAMKNPGKVYLWVVDTTTGYYVSCPITVKVSPSSLVLYRVPNTADGFDRKKTTKYTKADVNVGDAFDLYLDATYKDASNEVKVATGCAYTFTSSDETIATVEQDTKNIYHYIVKAKALKNGTSKGTAKITIACKESGKKVTFTVSTVNHVKSITLSDATKLTLDTATCAAITASTGAAVEGSVVMKTTPKKSELTAITDTLKVSPAMKIAKGYSEPDLEKGNIKVLADAKVTSCPVSVKLGTDKKSLTIKANKGATPGTYYFLLYYNNEPGGYEVLCVKVK